MTRTEPIVQPRMGPHSETIHFRTAQDNLRKLGISTGGNSANVVKAIAAIKQVGTIALAGERGGKRANFCIAVPTTINYIQEIHIAISHLVCRVAEEAIC